MKHIVSIATTILSLSLTMIAGHSASAQSSIQNIVATANIATPETLISPLDIKQMHLEDFYTKNSNERAFSKFKKDYMKDDVTSYSTPLLGPINFSVMDEYTQARFENTSNYRGNLVFSKERDSHFDYNLYQVTTVAGPNVKFSF